MESREEKEGERKKSYSNKRLNLTDRLIEIKKNKSFRYFSQIYRQTLKQLQKWETTET